mmetsp:Transcript_18214/g.43561  ORF Transcript_18214/g.43561 Transcript_18214/m.43561 type:complete len:106 (-) Transcript_18214:1456-1773(-)
MSTSRRETSQSREHTCMDMVYTCAELRQKGNDKQGQGKPTRVALVPHPMINFDKIAEKEMKDHRHYRHAPFSMQLVLCLAHIHHVKSRFIRRSILQQTVLALRRG